MQGALILLPAVFLAGMALYSLGKDGLLAEHQAAEQAKGLAGTISERIWANVIHSAPPAESILVQALSGLSKPEDDPILQLLTAKPSRIAFLTNGEGQLVYPRPPGEVAQSALLDLAELNATQLEAWQAMDAEEGRESGAVDLTVYETFVKSSPPAWFAAIATYRWAVACRRSGQANMAVGLLRGLLRADGDFASESGFPLDDFASAQLLELLPKASRGEIANALGSRNIARPTALTPLLLEKLAPLDDALTKWSRVHEAHDRARSFAAALPRDHGAILERDGEMWVISAVEIGGSRWTTATERGALIGAVQDALHAETLPQFLGAAVSYGPISILPLPATATARDLLATQTTDSPESGNLPLKVQIYLADPAGFHAQQRLHTLRYATLISASVAAVLIGFFAAWRAFRKQRRLSEMKTNFVSAVSHELRAPIASVQLMAEDLQAGAAEPGMIEEYLGFTVQECRRLSAIIENVLDFSRREQGREHFEFEEIDLVQLTAETVKVMQKYGAEKKVVIDLVTTGDASGVEADGRSLQRLLVNLLDNAIKHSAEAGRIITRLEFQPRLVALSVEDYGPGIPDAEHEKIFERFYRIGSELRRETQGVGLGLSIVKHIAEVHGGTIRVLSKLGEGSRFILELPLEREATA